MATRMLSHAKILPLMLMINSNLRSGEEKIVRHFKIRWLQNKSFFHLETAVFFTIS